MNASQRRIATRSILSTFHPGESVTLPTGKAATIIGASVSKGGSLFVKRGDNRKVLIPVRELA